MVAPATPENFAHLLRRTEFVAHPDRLAAFSGMTIAQAVDNILTFNPVVVPLPPGLSYHDDNNGYNQYVEATKWWMDRMAFDAPKRMQEKMTYFWHGHFCSSWDKVGRTDAMMNQNKLFRDQALGNFRTMTHAMSLQPAMLLYLDNVDNVEGEPNQNFARELLELFTIGVDPFGSPTPTYTEDDVSAAAAAWTGYGINWDTYQYEFHPGQHDDGQKTFYGTTKNWNGPDIINEVLRDNAAKRLITCKHLSRKLWEFFAYQYPAQTIVDELAQVLYDNDMEIRPWVAAMLNHDEFYTTTAKQGLVTSPIDWVVSIMIKLNLRSEEVDPQWRMDSMGQLPYLPPNVSGWRPNMYWVNTSVLAGRADFARSMTWRLREDDANDVSEMEIPDAINHVANMFWLSLSAQTTQAFTDFLTNERIAEPWGGWWQSTNLLTMTMLTPESHLA